MSAHSNAHAWKPMRIPSAGKNSALPGKRGRYLLWLEPPFIAAPARWVHFSWVEGSFCLRDFIGEQKRSQDGKTDATHIWRLAAKGRIPCRGKLYHPVQDHDFWKKELERRTQNDPR